MKQISEEVFYSEDQFKRVGRSQLDLLKQKAEVTSRCRSRLCVHENIDDVFHEMFIVHEYETYVRPHKHIGKTESFSVIEGTVEMIFFDAEGVITSVIEMGSYSSGKEFYCRIPEGQYHTMLITSEFLVFHEGILGPFDKEKTIFASWAPEEKESQLSGEFIKRLKNRE